MMCFSLLFISLILFLDVLADVSKKRKREDDSKQNTDNLIDILRSQNQPPRRKRTERIQVPLNRYKSYYDRRKAKKNSGDKEAIEWYRQKREKNRKSGKELTELIQSGKYSAKDYERYQRRLANGKRYDAKRVQKDGTSRSNQPERFKVRYQLKKEAKERCEKDAIDWFEKRLAYRRKSESELTKRIHSNTYSTHDLERYKKRVERRAKYKDKRQGSDS